MKQLAALLIIVSILLGGLAHPAAAQDGQNNVPPPGGGTTIHVVQRDETLFRIAMQYGTTVDDISAANGITDPRYISVGQRLLIPNVQFDAAGTASTYMVQPGDSLDTLAHTFALSADSLITDNRITNPRQLYVGQEITITRTAETVSSAQVLHHVRSGENLARIALAYHVTLDSLLETNRLSPLSPVFPGQRLWIPTGTNGTTPRDFPLPFMSYVITPTPAVQGKTISIHITTDGPATLTGDFMGYPVQIATQDANQHFALFGIHAFANSGVYPLRLTAEEPDGTQTELIVRVLVQDGEYGTEEISLETAQQDLLTTEVTEPEWQRVAMAMSGFTSQRYFDGLMGLPSTGAITSQFGTRRSYNGGQLDTFHSGTDFGGAPGSSILAPAAGVVVLADTLPVRGNATIIDHGWGVFTGYWHQSEIYVQVGDVVAPGQTIGAVGSTGRSTGPHLHWEMWVGGVQVDPMQWVQQRFP